MTAHSNPPAVVLHGGPSGPPRVLGQGSARIPIDGKIRAGIKVLSKRAAGEPRACEIYERGCATARPSTASSRHWPTRCRS